MTTMNKLVWLGGGVALGAIALRGSITRASRPSSLFIDEMINEPEKLAPSGGVSRHFDQRFARYGRGLPVAYLRSLAKRESNLNQREQSGPAWGLLQVIEVVRRDYNKRRGTQHERRDLLDPLVNIAIGSDLLRRIVRSYARNHPSAAHMQESWSNPRFVELLTFGWNAGYSERGGVGRVATYLEERGQAQQITIDTIHRFAKPAGASRHLSSAAKVAWCKGVSRLYQRERLRKERRS